MLFVRFILCLALPLGPANLEDVPDTSLEGTWKVSYFSSPSAEVANWIVKLQFQNGKLVGNLVASAREGEFALSKAELSNRRVHLVFKTGASVHVFEGWLGSDKDRITGAYEDERRLYIAHMTRTQLTTLGPADVLISKELPPPMQQAVELSGKFNQLHFQMQQAKEPDDKIKFLQQMIDAIKETQSELPKLFQETIDKHPEDIAVFDATLQLLRGATKNKATLDQAQQWAKASLQAAGKYGPGWEKEIAMQIAQTLGNQKDFIQLATQYAERAAELIKDTDTTARQRRVLKLLVGLQKLAGKSDTLRETEERLEKVESILDKDYDAKNPPLKVEPFAGRKSSSNRAVVLELFTAADSGPSVAPQMACDLLSQAYKPTELLVLQHHVNLPNTDSLSNPESEARFAEYRKKFPAEVRSTPVSCLNGKPKAIRGGAIADTAKKLAEYREIIDPLLEEQAGATLRIKSTCCDDKVDTQVVVSDVKGAADGLRLYVALVEDKIRYLGSNRIRFHYSVVRALPTGVEGVALPNDGAPYTVSVNLQELRAKMSKYLDDTAAANPVVNPDLPIEFKNLRVVAFVQDHKTNEIVQGAACDVTPPDTAVR